MGHRTPIYCRGYRLPRSLFIWSSPVRSHDRRSEQRKQFGDDDNRHEILIGSQIIVIPDLDGVTFSTTRTSCVGYCKVMPLFSTARTILYPWKYAKATILKYLS